MTTNGWMVSFGLGAGLLCYGVVGFLAAMALSSGRATTPTVLDVWGKIKAPPPPPVKPVRLAPDTTALLILDTIDMIRIAAK